MRGASALAEVLAGAPAVKAFVVWEPVLDSDTAPPGPSVALTGDARVHRYWDQKLTISRRLLAEASAPAHCLLGKDTNDPVVWDAVFVFPPGARWGDKLPAPAFCGRPVVRVADELRTQLRDAR